MEQELASKELGSEGALELVFKDGDVVLAVSHDSKGVGAKLEVKLKGDYFLDKLADAIPGEVDDSIIAILKGALKA